MTRETRKRELEIGIGLVLYLLAFLISMQAKMKSKAEMLLFLLPYIVSAISIYKEQAEKFLKKQFLDENLLMIIATVGAFFVGRYKEAVAAMLFYQVGKLVEEISLSRTKKSIAKFIDIRPEYANLKIGNTEKIVPPQELNLRQTIVLHPGDKIPVDAVVTSGTGTVDMKALTGEPDPVTVRIGDRLFSGSINLNSVLEARVEKLYNDSTAAKIMRLVESANENKSESVHFVDKFTKYYTPIVILIALLTVILPPMMFVEAKAEWIYRGLIILVAACPCGLMVSIPLMEDEPSKIINAVRIAKGTIRSVRENVLFAIGMKVFLVILAFFGLVTMQSAIIADMVVMVINILNSFWMMKYPESGV